MSAPPNIAIGEVATETPCLWADGHTMLTIHREMKRHVRVYDWCGTCGKIGNHRNEPGGWGNNDRPPRELMAFYVEANEAAWIRAAATERKLNVSSYLRVVVFADLAKR